MHVCLHIFLCAYTCMPDVFVHPFDMDGLSLQLFMKATQLEKICQDYEATRDNLDEMKRGIERKKQVCPVFCACSRRLHN